jgi:site-specific DNA-methyltransferase (adenine-specific)
LTDLAPVLLPLDQVDPHPDNPRIVRRDDVIDLIAAEITRSGFGTEHAILVRPLGERYQVVSGHNRREAALKAGIDQVPAWVRDLDADEAFMQLVLGNAQGELSPLEIGFHAKKAVDPGKGGRGITGGLSEYAKRIGRSLSGLSMLRAAAEVYLETLHTCEGFPLAEYHRHLYEVSKAHRKIWPLLVGELARRQWSVKETATAVADVNKFDIPIDWTDWLPLPAVVERYLQGRFSPDTVARLIAAAEDVATWIGKNAPCSGTGDLLLEFTQWLEAEDVADRRKIGAYKAKLIAEKRERDAEAARREEAAARAAYVVPGWHHGRWQEFVDEIDDGSVSLVLTDPPYGMDYRSNYRKEQHKPIEGDGTSGADHARDVVVELQKRGKFAPGAHILVFCSWREELDVRAALAEAGLHIRGSLIWDKQATGMGDLDRTFAPAHERIVHAAIGDPKLYSRAPDLLAVPRVGTDRHPTEKPEALLATLIEATTAPGQLVADPFGGVASTAAAAKATDRRWWSCEMDEGYWQAGEGRLS